MAVTDGVGLVTQSVIQAAELSLSESVQVASDDIRVTPAGRARRRVPAAAAAASGVAGVPGSIPATIEATATVTAGGPGTAAATVMVIS